MVEVMLEGQCESGSPPFRLKHFASSVTPVIGSRTHQSSIRGRGASVSESNESKSNSDPWVVEDEMRNEDDEVTI
jgi:hypothetical protein